jgi:hypothetical protein
MALLSSGKIHIYYKYDKTAYLSNTDPIYTLYISTKSITGTAPFTFSILSTGEVNIKDYN